VTTGYIFQVAVKAKKGTESIVREALITATINSAQDITDTLSSSKIEDLVMELASGS